MRACLSFLITTSFFRSLYLRTIKADFLLRSNISITTLGAMLLGKLQGMRQEAEKKYRYGVRIRHYLHRWESLYQYSGDVACPQSHTVFAYCLLMVAPGQTLFLLPADAAPCHGLLLLYNLCSWQSMASWHNRMIQLAFF